MKKSRVSKFRAILTLGISAIMLFACVPGKQFDAVKKREADCLEENGKLKNENQNLSTENTEMKSAASEMQKKISSLARDTTEMGIAYQRMAGLYGEMTKSYDRLLANNEKLLEGNNEETKKLILQLNKTQEDLKKREDQLYRDSIALKDKQMKVAELEGILKQYDSTLNKIKTSVSNALKGYENNGLSIYEKEGRVYVSMEEKLLFASGSTNVEKKGEEALKDLSKVLSTNKDINILVEGHTDNVPISGTLPSGARDNWELSVLRATSVVKIILADKSVLPNRVTATGKGPYEPLDAASTAEARKKNRRTEIILSPKLDELKRVLGY